MPVKLHPLLISNFSVIFCAKYQTDTWTDVDRNNTCFADNNNNNALIQFCYTTVFRLLITGISGLSSLTFFVIFEIPGLTSWFKK